MLRELDYDLIHDRIPLRGMLDDVPLRYLSSQLYVNFSMLWPETITLIESHGNSMNRDKLWKCFEELLTTAANNCMGELWDVCFCFIFCSSTFFSFWFWVRSKSCWCVFRWRTNMATSINMCKEIFEQTELYKVTSFLAIQCICICILVYDI